MTSSPGKGLAGGVPRPARTEDLVRRLVRERLRPHALRLAVALAFMAIVAAGAAGNAWLMQPALDDVFINRDQVLLYLVPLAIVAVTLVKGLASYCQAALMEYVGQRMVASIQREMYARLMTADLGFYADTPTGQLIARFTNDAQLLRSTLIGALTGLVRDALTLVFLVALMFYQNWLMALIAFVVFPSAVVPIVAIGRRMRRVSAGTQMRLADLTTRLDETFEGARVVKAYGMEAHETARAGAIIDSVFRLGYKAGRVRAISRPISESLGGIAAAGVILFGGSQVLAGATTPGTFFSFMTALLLAYQPLKSIASLHTSLQEGLAAVERVFAVLDMEPAIVDAPDAVPLEMKRGEIRFSGVRFAYGHGAAALEDLDLVVPAGMTAALVGPSGAGKSTVLNLIPRFYDVDAGAVTIDGHDVRSVTMKSLRAAIALVSQEVTLFDDTIGANIAYGRPGATMAEIVEAAKNAGAHDFIAALPDGYDSGVGGRGVKLSGGERQRIAIARAMLRDAPILLLDEATSALDSETERQVREALARLKKGRTTLVIAHRLSTVVDSDIIYVLERGRVVETGSHGQLLARGGAYARQYALQFAGADGEPVAAAAGAGR